jgi:hypothetical protein
MNLCSTAFTFWGENAIFCFSAQLGLVLRFEGDCIRREKGEEVHGRGEKREVTG